MRLSPEERQTFLGPLVVGVLVGAFVAYAAFALNSEYRLNGIPIGTVQLIAESTLGFLLAVVSTVSLLGVLPILIHRKRNRPNSDA